MKVKVNRKTIDLFEEARVKHALLKYFIARKWNAAQVDRLVVRDAAGQLLDHDAPLNVNPQISFKLVT